MDVRCYYIAQGFVIAGFGQRLGRMKSRIQEYVKSFDMKLDGKNVRWRSLDQETITKLANAHSLMVKAEMYVDLPPQGYTEDINDGATKEYKSEVSLGGSSAALRFCNFID